MARPERFIRIAYNTSAQANCTFLIGATIALGSRVVSTGHCTKKTHPQNPKIKAPTKRNQLCAEVNATLRALKILPREKIKECSIYIARSRRDGSVGMAKPCPFCLSFLKDTGIRDVYYTTNAGSIKRMEI